MENASTVAQVSKQKDNRVLLNKEYEVQKNLGEGKTSKVYLCQHIKDPKTKVAMKLYKEEFLNKNDSNKQCVEKEIKVLSKLNHKNIIKLYDFGSEGQIKKKSGRVIKDLTYILMEKVDGPILFDFCRDEGAMGEDYGRFFMNQLVDVMSYMQERNVVHRDLKLENILIDEQLNLKIADFGFACNQNVHKLTSYKGTTTYMAPEIKEGLMYDGRKTDVFSAGVILFIIVVGIFPFLEAKKSDKFYSRLHLRQYDEYWQLVKGEYLSPEFKDLMQQIFKFKGSNRITLDQIKKHPWMKAPGFNIKEIKDQILKERMDKISIETTETTLSDGTKSNE